MTEQRLRGVYWGRFNPPHKGHLAMVRRFRRRCRLTVAIGSAEHKGERADPFSGRERTEMMRAYLSEAKIEGVRVVSLRDGASLAWAIDNMVRRCRPDVVFLSSESSRLARMTSARVRVIRFQRTGRISSTRLRDSIAAGRTDWTRLTGRTVVRWILSHDGVARIRASYGRNRSATLRERGR